eukprot:TRINITY_DN10263_c0_g1_i14.p1 TRINITY_DN10263_c0_g1~~TRINITY_DN10263_c0_g1_i14.p1  ORF type:complete len:110 (+),score=34.51 TRINITY_DN10263_c0_g1_i14:127-456(+)
MIRRPPRSTLSSSSAASDVYKRQVSTQSTGSTQAKSSIMFTARQKIKKEKDCLLYTSDAADEEDSVDLGGRRIIKKKKKKDKKYKKYRKTHKRVEEKHKKEEGETARRN